MNQMKMMTLRGTAVSRKSNDEILKDIMITLMIAAAISLFMCYLPLIADAATKSSTASGGGTVTKVFNSLSQGIYEETAGVTRPLAIVCLGLCALCHFGYPGSALDRKLQGWPMRIILAFCAVALAPTIIDYFEKLLKDNGLFTWK